jgi:hypothetical protein
VHPEEWAEHRHEWGEHREEFRGQHHADDAIETFAHTPSLARFALEARALFTREGTFASNASRDFLRDPLSGRSCSHMRLVHALIATTRLNMASTRTDTPRRKL